MSNMCVCVCVKSMFTSAEFMILIISMIRSVIILIILLFPDLVSMCSFILKSFIRKILLKRNVSRVCVRGRVICMCGCVCLRLLWWWRIKMIYRVAKIYGMKLPFATKGVFWILTHMAAARFVLWAHINRYVIWLNSFRSINSVCESFSCASFWCLMSSQNVLIMLSTVLYITFTDLAKLFNIEKKNKMKKELVPASQKALKRCKKKKNLYIA